MSKKAKRLRVASKILGALGLIGGLGGINSSNSATDNLHSALGSMVLGGVAYGLEKAAQKADRKHQGKGMHGYGIKEHHHKIIHNILDMPKAIHVKELGIPAPLMKRYMTALDKYNAHMAKLEKSGKGVFKKAGHQLKKFFQGKTKFKPSSLLNYGAHLASIASYIPAIGLPAKAVSVGLELGSQHLKSKGKGMSGGLLTGETLGIEHQPELRGRGMEDNQSGGDYHVGKGLTVSGAGLKLAGKGLMPVGAVPPMPRKKLRKYGTRIQVMKGECQCTKGGLYKKDLMINPKTGKIVSKRMVERGKKLYEMRMKKKK